MLWRKSEKEALLRMGTINPFYRNIEQLLSQGPFAIDEYQREYGWSKENIEQLLADLLTQFKNSYKTGDRTDAVAAYGDYFLGSIIVGKRENTKFLIDGQQRVTSLTLLLIYLHRLVKEKEDLFRVATVGLVDLHGPFW